MKVLKDRQEHGFTLIELLIATVVFSIILIVATAALIQVGRLYYKGVVSSKTQGVARSTIDDVSRSIQFSSGSMQQETHPSKNYIRAYCFGNTRFTYVEGAQVNSGAPIDTYNESTRVIRHALWQDKIGTETCQNNMPDLTKANPYEGISPREGRALLEEGMRLQTFNVCPGGSCTDLFNVNVKIVYYSAADLLNNFDNPTSCKGSVVGGQWCAISDLTSVVYSRSQ